MSNALYDKGREGFLAGDIDWDADTIMAVLIDEALYTVDLAAHDFLDDVSADFYLIFEQSGVPVV